ncbi:MAG: hypothetical protein ACM3H7_08760, partial [Acidobacteriaceae bacterium]
CYLPIDYFKSESANNEYDLFDMDRIARFIVALEEGNIKESFPGVSNSVTVKNSDNLMRVLKVLREEQVNMAAVLSGQGRYLGVLFSQDVERKIADAVLKSQSA